MHVWHVSPDKFQTTTTLNAKHVPPELFIMRTTTHAMSVRTDKSPPREVRLVPLVPADKSPFPDTLYARRVTAGLFITRQPTHATRVRSVKPTISQDRLPAPPAPPDKLQASAAPDATHVTPELLKTPGMTHATPARRGKLQPPDKPHVLNVQPDNSPMTLFHVKHAPADKLQTPNKPDARHAESGRSLSTAHVKHVPETPFQTPTPAHVRHASAEPSPMTTTTAANHVPPGLFMTP